MTRLAWRLARPALARLARADLAVERARSAAHRVLEAALPALLTPHELAELSASLYEQRPSAAAREVMEWERAWLALLPPAPAHGLVGGAGEGPECHLLLQSGYTMDAYDPSAVGVATCQRVLRDSGVAFRAIHEDLAAGVRPPRSRYDFVWLGWGSVSHVLSEDARMRLFEASARLTDGPILGSCRCSAEASDAPRGGPGLRRLLGRLGLAPASPRTLYQPQVGLAVTLAPEELGRIAERIDRQLLVGDGRGITPFAMISPR